MRKDLVSRFRPALCLALPVSLAGVRIAWAEAHPAPVGMHIAEGYLPPLWAAV